MYTDSKIKHTAAQIATDSTNRPLAGGLGFIPLNAVRTLFLCAFSNEDAYCATGRKRIGVVSASKPLLELATPTRWVVLALAGTNVEELAGFTMYPRMHLFVK